MRLYTYAFLAQMWHLFTISFISFLSHVLAHCPQKPVLGLLENHRFFQIKRVSKEVYCLRPKNLNLAENLLASVRGIRTYTVALLDFFFSEVGEVGEAFLHFAFEAAGSGMVEGGAFESIGKIVLA